MFSQDDDGQQGLVVALVLGVVLMLVGLMIGLGIHQNSQRNRSDTPTQALAVNAPAPVLPLPSVVVPTAASVAPADAASASQQASDAASIKVENGVVKFYFASGQSGLAAGASDALAGLIKGTSGGRKLVVSGFHDATGDATKNAALARLRAMAVRDALTAAGVAEQQIELKKPEATAGSGSDAEARRVEVSLR